MHYSLNDGKKCIAILQRVFLGKREEMKQFDDFAAADLALQNEQGAFVQLITYLFLAIFDALSHELNLSCARLLLLVEQFYSAGAADGDYLMCSDGAHRKRKLDDDGNSLAPGLQSSTISNSEPASSLSVDNPILNDKEDVISGAFEGLKIADNEKPEANCSRRTFEFHNMLKTIKDKDPVGTSSCKILYVLCKTEAEYKVKCGIPLKLKDINDCKRAALFAGKDGAIFDELFRKSYLQECRERTRGSTSSSVGNDGGNKHDYEIYGESLPTHPCSFIGKVISAQLKQMEENDTSENEESSE